MVKTLIIVDTNKIRLNENWEKDFSKFDVKGDFSDLVDWIEKNKLEEEIKIAIPEIVFEEYISARDVIFQANISKIKNTVEKFSKMECVNCDNLELPENYDYKAYLREKIKEYLKSKRFIFKIGLDSSKYTEILLSIIKRAYDKKQPFSKEGDKGFKDALIWESILNYPHINDYDKIILFTENKNDFGEICNKEFKNTFDKHIIIEPLRTRLEVILDESYEMIIKHGILAKRALDQYFIEEMKNELSYDGGFESLDVIEPLVSIDEIESIEDLGQSARYYFDDYSLEDLSTIKIIKSKVNVSFSDDEDAEWIVESYIDTVSNEILYRDYGLWETRNNNDSE